MKECLPQLHYGNLQFYNRGRNRISAVGRGWKRMVGNYHHNHHYHKHQGLDPLTRSIYGVTAARANASSVFQLFSFLVVWSGMISKDLWHPLQVKKPVPSIFSRKLTWPCQYTHQPLVEWKPKILHNTNTVIKVKVPLFALCQHWLKLHVLCSHHDGSPWQVYSRKCHHSTEKGWLSVSTAKESLRKYRRDQQVGMRKATGFCFAITAGRRRTSWLATASAWYESHREYVEWGVKGTAGNLACPPSQK